jgi:F-box interacting protein
MFISNSDRATRSVDFEASLYDDSAISVSHNLNFLLPNTCEDLEIKSSCRGIIVMRCRSEFHLWNPSTRVHKQIILSPNDHYINFFGFGYDKSTDDYLVISMSTWNTISDESYLEIFSLRANTWKQIGSTHIRYSFLEEDNDTPSGVGLLFNGAIHWLAWRYDHDLKESVIVAFDLMERKLLDMHLPHDFEPKSQRFGLCVFGEFLSLWYTDFLINNTVEIWVMNEYKLHSSWTKTIVLPVVGFPDEYFAPLCSTKSGDIVTTDYGGTGLAKFDGKGQLLEYRSHRDHYDVQGYKETLYIDSLLSLHNEQP